MPAQDAPAIPLPRRPYGIEKFRVEGTLDGAPVHARWDGRWAIVSNVLWERVALAQAVDEALAEAGMTTQFQHACLRRSPEDVMLAVVSCCDDIDVAEFEIRSRHRVITSDTSDAGDAVPTFREDRA